VVCVSLSDVSVSLPDHRVVTASGCASVSSPVQWARSEFLSPARAVVRIKRECVESAEKNRLRAKCN
jgi:hypothetical protein